MLKRASRREVSCRQVDAWLMAYLKGGLPSRRRQTVDEHLAGCDACRRALHDARALEDQLRLQAAHDYPTLSPQASTRIQTRVYRRMRRSMVTQRVSRMAWGVAAVLILVLVAVGGYAFWQQWQQDAGQATPAAVPESTKIPGLLESGPVVITFACPDTQRPYYEQLARSFETANPDLQVQLVSLDEVLGPPLSDGQYAGGSARRLASAADTLAILPDPDMVRRGLLRDLTPFIEADRAFDAEDFYTLEALQWNDGTWGLPVDIWLLVLILYDKDVFDDAGVSYPEPGWTWDDFLHKAQALTEWEGEEVLRWGFVESAWVPTPFVQGRVGVQVDGANGPAGASPDGSAVADAMRWYLDLILVHEVMPSPNPDSRQGALLASQAAQLVSAGKAAMWSESSLLWDHWQAGRRLGMVPFPVDNTSSATTPVWTDAVVMSAGAANPEASWRWLKFLSQQPPVVGRMPARRSVAESSGYWEGLDAEQAAAYRNALEHAMSPAKNPLALELDLDGLRAALQLILDGEKDVEQVLAEMSGQAEAEIGREAGEQATEPVVVATPEPVQTAEDEGEVIVFVPRDFAAGAAVYKDLAEEFHQAHPDIVVEILPDVASGVSMSGHELLPLLADKADCFAVVWQTWYPEDRVHFLPLDPLVEADASFSLADFYTPAVEAVRLEGQLLALPKELYPWMVFYHTAALDAEGLEYPSPDWSLDDFLALAVALTDDEDSNERYGYWPPPDHSDLLFFLEQYGAQLVDLSTDPATYHFDAPVTIDAVRWYVALSTEHGVMPEPTFTRLDSETYNVRWQSWRSATESGQTAMWPDSLQYTLSLFTSEQTEGLGMAPMPQGPGLVASFTQQAYAVSAQTEHPQACWEWLKFLTEQSAIFEDAQNGLPARHSVAASAVYRQQVGEETATLYEDAIAQGKYLSSARQAVSQLDTGYPFVWFYGALDSIVGGEDADAVLGEAQRKAEAYVVCLQTKQDIEGDELAEACVREIDPDFTFYGSDE